MKRIFLFGLFLFSLSFVSIAQEADDTEKWTTKFNSLLSSQQWTEILSHAATCSQELPSWNELSFYTGVAKLNLNQTEGAIQDLSLYIDNAPDFAFAYLSRGNAYLALNNPGSAILDFSKCLSLDSPNEREAALLGRANANAMLNDYTNVFTDLNEAITINPNNASSREFRANLYIINKQWNEAIVDLSQVIALIPNNAKAFAERAFAQYSLRSAESIMAAIQDYNKALEIENTNVTWYHQRSACNKAIKDYAAEIIDYDKILELVQNDSQTFYKRGIAKFRLEKYDEAIKDFDEAIKINPEYIDAFQNRAASKSKNKDAKGAAADMEKVKELKNKKQ